MWRDLVHVQSRQGQNSFELLEVTGHLKHGFRRPAAAFLLLLEVGVEFGA